MRSWDISNMIIEIKKRTIPEMAIPRKPCIPAMEIWKLIFPGTEKVSLSTRIYRGHYCYETGQVQMGITTLFNLHMYLYMYLHICCIPLPMKRLRNTSKGMAMLGSMIELRYSTQLYIIRQIFLLLFYLYICRFCQIFRVIFYRQGGLSCMISVF